MFDFIFSLIRKPQVIFIYNIISSWYVMIMLPAIYVTYYVFKGLESSGLLAKIFNFIRDKLDICVNIAKNCSVLIGDLRELVNCVTIQ